MELGTVNFNKNNIKNKDTREFRVPGFEFQVLANQKQGTRNLEPLFKKAYGQLVLLDFDITAFTSVAYQRGSLPRSL